MRLYKYVYYMKNIVATLALALLAVPAMAQAAKTDQPKEPDYQFTTVKENPITSIKNQYRSGTCWCFSSMSFLESELLRTQNKTYDLSEMWVVSHAYHDRAVKYVRMDGKMGFAAGSGFGDVLTTIKRYGIVPENIYSGMKYGSDKPEQAELDAVLKAYVDAIVKNPNKTLSTAWKNGFDAVLQAYMGQWPATFVEDAVNYTPAEYRDNVLKFNADDYINICSFMEEPWYDYCPIDVCDNWRNEPGYNVPMEDMMRILYHALDNGYTVLWGGDVSEKGFTRNGIGVMPKPKADAKPAAGSDQEHWVGKDTAKPEEPAAVEIPEEEEVNDALRQEAYDRKKTTDDHGMHIYGYATDQNGTKYFMVKNSWGEAGKYKGIWYMSDTYVAYKTLNYLVHKDALPKDIKKRLNIK